MDSFYEFYDNDASFYSEIIGHHLRSYMPLCGVSEKSIKSSITPFLSGDIKLDKHRYLTKPTSREDLIYPVRNVFVQLNGQHIISTSDITIHPKIYAGQLWYRTVRYYPSYGCQIETINFVPISGENVELMKITIKNVSNEILNFQLTFAIPLFCRSLNNKHDHEHVTSLLNRIEQNKYGVCVKPTMKFNEEGHQINQDYYFVFGKSDDNQYPEGSFPTVNNFYGYCGNGFYPQALYDKRKPQKLYSQDLTAKEAMGALQFKESSLFVQEKKEYIIHIGTSSSQDSSYAILKKFSNVNQFHIALDANQSFWRRKSTSLQFFNGDQDYMHWFKWVMLQPIMRRIYGCSFLPDHDYGKGGKGWRDIWQDLFSLILIEPENIRHTLVHNFSGVRIDGSNATIIGDGENQFISDRNSILRVWMDHGVWPCLTLKLYIDQTGDTEILFQKISYFQDLQFFRGKKRYTDTMRNKDMHLHTSKDEIYYGCILEHLLVELLVPFFNVGEHNIIRLENADWNDGLDMASDRGESVCFTFLYGNAFKELIDVLQYLQKNILCNSISIAKELVDLITVTDEIIFNSITHKNKILQDYFVSVSPYISGETVKISISDIIDGLDCKYNWIKKYVPKQEWVQARGHRWINGYYDNQGKQVEGEMDHTICMTLSGQVFSIMSGMLSKKETSSIIKSVDNFLKDTTVGGYRLNTNFNRDVYLSLGRAFGFGFGTKENGAFFSHMIIMYAYALYKQRFGKQAYQVLQSVYRMSNQWSKSYLCPGVPEYIDGDGIGMYPYLTGAASWWVLAEVTQSFGVRGKNGDLMLDPQLVFEQFHQGIARIIFPFHGYRIDLRYHNKQQLDLMDYNITRVDLRYHDKSQLDLMDHDIVKSKDCSIIISHQDLADKMSVDVYLDKISAQ